MLMQEGDQVVDSKAFRAATQDWSMARAHKFNFRYKKSDSSRNVVCTYDSCPFRSSATYSTTRQCVGVVSIGGEHNCIGAGRISHSPSSLQTWLQRLLPTVFAISESTGPREIVDAIKPHHHHVTITYDASKKAKWLLLSDDVQQRGHQFQLLSVYTDAARAADPEARVQLSIEGRDGTVAGHK